MNWNVTVNGSPQTVGNNLVVAFYDPSVPANYPNTPVATQVITGPFPGTFNLTFTGLSAIVYRLVVWDTSGTIPGGTARNDFSLQPTVATIQIRTSLYLTADVTTGFSSGTNTYTDSSLSGWNYDIEQKGLGTLQYGVEVSKTDTSWTWLVGNFNTQQQFILHFYPIVSAQPIVSTSNLVTGTRLITANTTLTNADMTKGILLQGASSQLAITLPALSTVADNLSIFLMSAGGNHNNVVINPAGADTFQFKLFKNQSTASSQLTLGQSENMTLLKANGIWNVISGGERMLKVGEIVYSYGRQEMNTLLLNGTQGLLRADYPALWSFISQLESSCICSQAAWPNVSIINGFAYYINKAKFNTGDGTTTFGLPDLTIYGMMKAADGSTRYPGNFQNFQVGQFNANQGDNYLNHPYVTTLVGRGQANPNTLVLNTGLDNIVNNTAAYISIRY